MLNIQLQEKNLTDKRLINILLGYYKTLCLYNIKWLIQRDIICSTIARYSILHLPLQNTSGFILKTWGWGRQDHSRNTVLSLEHENLWLQSLHDGTRENHFSTVVLGPPHVYVHFGRHTHTHTQYITFQMRTKAVAMQCMNMVTPTSNECTWNL